MLIPRQAGNKRGLKIAMASLSQAAGGEIYCTETVNPCSIVLAERSNAGTAYQPCWARAIYIYHVSASGDESCFAPQEIGSRFVI
jgi:hypothetical protein